MRVRFCAFDHIPNLHKLHCCEFLLNSCSMHIHSKMGRFRMLLFKRRNVTATSLMVSKLDRSRFSICTRTRICKSSMPCFDVTRTPCTWYNLMILHFHFTRLLVVTEGTVKLLVQGILSSFRCWFAFRPPSTHSQNLSTAYFPRWFHKPRYGLVTVICTVQAWLRRASRVKIHVM